MFDLSALTQPSSSLAYFELLVKNDHEFALLEAAFAVAQDEYEYLDIQQELDSVDQWVQRLRRQIPANANSLRRLHVLNHFFYQELGFAANVNDYYAPDNSYLNRVLQTRRGIAISLAILWLELATQIGIKAKGVNFPGHFLIKVTLAQGQVILDPLDARSLTGNELATRLEPFQKSMGLKGELQAPLGLYLQEAHPRDVVARLLRNLKEIYRAQGDWDRMVCVQNRLIVLWPDSWGEYRDRGLALAKLKRKAQAVRDFDVYLQNSAQAQDRELVLLARAQMLS